MTVNLHGDLRVCMAELLADVEYVRTIAEKLRSKSVPQIVKPDVPETGLAKYSLEVTPFQQASQLRIGCGSCGFLPRYSALCRV